MGGGVAALATCLLRQVPELSSQLNGADVTCTAFACPPVMTLGLAASCAAFITTVVHNVRPGRSHPLRLHVAPPPAPRLTPAAEHSAVLLQQ